MAEPTAVATTVQLVAPEPSAAALAVARARPAAEAIRDAGTRRGARRYRVGLRADAPLAYLTVGGICFPKATSRFAGDTEQKVRGTIVELTADELARVLEAARYKYVRVVGGDREARSEVRSTRSVVGEPRPGDRPVYVDGDPKASLIYLEPDPVEDAPVPVALEEALRQASLPPSTPPPFPEGRAAVAAARKHGGKITPAGTLAPGGDAQI